MVDQGRDDYIEPQPPVFPGEFDVSELEENETFDWTETSAVCTAPHVKHKAYGKTYSEFRKHRISTGEDLEPTKTARLYFRGDPTITQWLPSLARRREIPFYMYLNDMLQEGQIHFHPDYHDKYSIINLRMDTMSKTLENEEQLKYTSQLQKQTITLQTSQKGNHMFGPAVPEWLASDIRSVTMDLHIGMSDLCFLYVCIGIVKSDIPEMPVPAIQEKMFKDFIKKFENQLDTSYFLANTLYDQFVRCCDTVTT